MAGLFESPTDVLNRRRAALNKTIQGLSAKQGDNSAQQTFKGLGQIGLALAGMQQRKEQEEQLGALGGTLGGFQTEQDAIADVDRTNVGYSPQVLAQQEAATNKLRDEAIAGSGLGTDVQAAAQTQDILKRFGGSPEGMARAGQAMLASGNYEGGIKALQVAKAMQGETVAPKDLVTKKEVQPDGTLRNAWYDKQGNLIKVGGIATDPSAKVKVNVENGVKPWAAINTQYRADTKDILSGYKDVKRVENALSVKGGASNQALQAGLADTFGGSTRALANLQQWASFGSLDERVANTVSKFVAGTYTDTSKKDAARLLHAYKTNLAREHQAINGRYERVGEANNVASNTFLLDVLETAPTLDFSSMSPQELLNVDDSNLEDWQVDDLTDAFKRLTQ